MDPIFLLLRLLHVLLGVFWAGTIFFFASFMFPVLSDLGPDAGKVMGALQRRRYMDAMPVIATVTVVSGLLLFYRVSGGFDPAYMGSKYGMGYGLGGGAAIIASIIGIAMVRPSAARMGKMMQSMAALPAGPEREAAMVEVTRLRQRLANASKVVTLLLLLAVIMMAITRYL